MYSFLLALIEKRRVGTSKQTLLSFFTFLAEILKYIRYIQDARDPRFHITGS